MPGGVGERPLLPPSGHPAVHQARIAGQRDVRAEAHALGDPRAEALDEHVGAFDQPEHLLDLLGILEVGLDDAAAALDLVAVPGGRNQTRTLHADDVGAEVGEQCRGVRAGTETRELDDADTRERTLLLNSFSGHSSNLTRVRWDHSPRRLP